MVPVIPATACCTVSVRALVADQTDPNTPLDSLDSLILSSTCVAFFDSPVAELAVAMDSLDNFSSLCSMICISM